MSLREVANLGRRSLQFGLEVVRRAVRDRLLVAEDAS